MELVDKEDVEEEEGVGLLNKMTMAIKFENEKERLEATEEMGRGEQMVPEEKMAIKGSTELESETILIIAASSTKSQTSESTPMIRYLSQVKWQWSRRFESRMWEGCLDQKTSFESLFAKMGGFSRSVNHSIYLKYLAQSKSMGESSSK